MQSLFEGLATSLKITGMAKGVCGCQTQLFVAYHSVQGEDIEGKRLPSNYCPWRLIMYWNVYQCSTHLVHLSTLMDLAEGKRLGPHGIAVDQDVFVLVCL